MIKLPIGNSSGHSWLRFCSLRYFSKTALRSVPIPLGHGNHLPLRVRPFFVVITTIVLILLGLLGFSKKRHQLAISDKPLHFVCFTFATALFYWIWDVQEPARRLWYWRRAPAIITSTICFFCEGLESMRSDFRVYIFLNEPLFSLVGGLVSEVVQGLLPSHVFDWGDVFCNWLGSCLGLFVSERLESHYRHQRELRRLYQPLDAADEDYEDDEYDIDLEESQTTTEPLSRRARKPTSGDDDIPSADQSPQTAARPGTSVNNDVWSTREEIFSLGDDS